MQKVKKSELVIQIEALEYKAKILQTIIDYAKSDTGRKAGFHSKLFSLLLNVGIPFLEVEKLLSE